MATPVREVYAMLGGDNGLEGRATSCARGSAMLEHQTSPYRVRTPLKRVGPRGSGQWPIWNAPRGHGHEPWRAL